MTRERITASAYRALLDADAAPKPTLQRIGSRIAMTPGYSEDDLSRVCCALLESEGWYQPQTIRKTNRTLCEALDVAKWQPGELLTLFKSRGYRLYLSTQQKRRAKFVSTGMSDLWVQGVGWIELKAPGAPIRDEQQVMIACGAARVVRHPDELAELLRVAK